MNKPKRASRLVGALFPTNLSMLSLEPHHIVDLFLWVDRSLPIRLYPQGGRPSILRDSTLVSILLWDTLALHQKTLKDMWTFARLHLSWLCPRLSSYSAFVAHCHRVTPQMYELLQQLLVTDDPIKIGDS